MKKLTKAILVSSLALAAGCVNVGYKYEVLAIKVTGKVPDNANCIGIVEPASAGFYEMIAWGVVRKLAKGDAEDAVPVVGIVVKENSTGDSPLWARIPSFATLTIFPLYVTGGRHFDVELLFPEGKMEYAIDVSAHGFTSCFPTGFLPIPGFYMRRYWDAGPLSDCGMHQFSEIAVRKATEEVLRKHKINEPMTERQITNYVNSTGQTQNERSNP